MQNQIEFIGKVVFNPEDRTRKHKEQSSWKRMAMVDFDGDIAEYYAWFIQRRYNLVLNKPLRGAHVSFINDHIRDIKGTDDKDKQALWNKVKKKWDGKEVKVVLDLDPKTDDKHWWLRVSYEHRETLQGIRDELGLGKPYWGLHMTIGYANEKNIEHSKYIHQLIKKGFIRYD